MTGPHSGVHSCAKELSREGFVSSVCRSRDRRSCGGGRDEGWSDDRAWEDGRVYPRACVRQPGDPLMTYPDRVGLSSRITRSPGATREWRIDDERSFALPVVVDLTDVNPQTLEPTWRIAATVDLVDGRPALTRVDVVAPRGLELTRLQREFRWSTPLEIVTTMVPHLLAQGIDPLTYQFPTSGFPDVLNLRRRSPARLSDAFLAQVAREYLHHGRGYAAAAARERHVSPRTVSSWIEKARRRGILTEVPRGGFGGNLSRDTPVV